MPEVSMPQTWKVAPTLIIFMHTFSWRRSTCQTPEQNIAMGTVHPCIGCLNSINNFYINIGIEIIPKLSINNNVSIRIKSNLAVKFYTRIFSDQRRSTKNIVEAETKPNNSERPVDALAVKKVTDWLTHSLKSRDASASKNLDALLEFHSYFLSLSSNIF